MIVELAPDEVELLLDVVDDAVQKTLRSWVPDDTSSNDGEARDEFIDAAQVIIAKLEAAKAAGGGEK